MPNPARYRRWRGALIVSDWGVVGVLPPRLTFSLGGTRSFFLRFTISRALPVIATFTLRFLPLAIESFSLPRMFGAPRREELTPLVVAFFGSSSRSVPTQPSVALSEQVSVSGTDPFGVIVATGWPIDSGGR